MVRRGRKPSWTAWRVTENAPEITACEAITVASVASATIGIRLQCGNSRKNGLSIAARRVQDQRALAHVVEDQRGEDGGEPGAADRRAPEVAHVRVQRLGARDREHHRAERDERDVAVVEQEADPVGRRDRLQDLGLLDDLVQPGDGEDREPSSHHRPEQAPDRARPEALGGEQHGQDRERERHDELVQRRLDDFDPLDRREHRDRRRDHAVAVEQRGAEDAERDEHDLRGAALEPDVPDQRDQGHDPALALVVGAHDEHDVLDRDDDRDRPEHERDHAVDAGLGRPDRVLVGGEDRLQRVQRARPDVAEDDAERAQRQRGHALVMAAPHARRLLLGRGRDFGRGGGHGATPSYPGPVRAMGPCAWRAPRAARGWSSHWPR